MVSEEGVGPFLLGHEREGVGFLVSLTGGPWWQLCWRGPEGTACSVLCIIDRSTHLSQPWASNQSSSLRQTSPGKELTDG